MKTKLIFATVLCAASLLRGEEGHSEAKGAAAPAAKAPSAAAAATAKRAANTVVLDETGVKNLGLETVEAEETAFEETVFTLGRIEILPGSRAMLSSRIPGRALSVLAIPDQTVDKGIELAWVESRQPGDPPPVIKLVAPMAGTVTKVNIAVGQPVSPDEGLMEIVNLSQVEAAAQVPEHLAGKLVVGQTAHIRVTAFPDKMFEAKLAHLGVLGNAESGTLEAAFHVPNPDKLLRPGMRAEFSIVLSKREDVMSIPRAALQGEGADRFVYAEDFDLKNAYIKTPVVIGQQNDRFVEILSGLLPGDKVVTRGAYSLAFAGKGSVSLKEALDAAHGHEHAEDGSELTPEKKAAAEAAKKGAAGGGHDHGAAASSGLDNILYWRISTGILLLMFVLSMIRRKQPTEAEEHEGESIAVKSHSIEVKPHQEAPHHAQ